VAVLTLRAPNKLTDTRNKNIHRTYRFTIVILFHVEGFNLFWIIRHNGWAFKILFGQKSFMLSLKIYAPRNWEIKFMSF